MGFNMSGSKVGRGECFQPKGVQPDACSPGKSFHFYSSPADRGTKKHVYLPYRGAIPFWFYLVPLKVVSIFLNVGHFEISCGLLLTRFSSILL